MLVLWNRFYCDNPHICITKYILHCSENIYNMILSIEYSCNYKILLYPPSIMHFSFEYIFHNKNLLYTSPSLLNSMHILNPDNLDNNHSYDLIFYLHLMLADSQNYRVCYYYQLSYDSMGEDWYYGVNSLTTCNQCFRSDDRFPHS